MYRNNRRTNTTKRHTEDNGHKILDQEKLLRAFCRYTPIMLLSTSLDVLIVEVRSVCIDATAVSNPGYSTIYGLYSRIVKWALYYLWLIITLILIKFIIVTIGGFKGGGAPPNVTFAHPGVS